MLPLLLVHRLVVGAKAVFCAQRAAAAMSPSASEQPRRCAGMGLNRLANDRLGTIGSASAIASRRRPDHRRPAGPAPVSPGPPPALGLPVQLAARSDTSVTAGARIGFVPLVGDLGYAPVPMPAAGVSRRRPGGAAVSAHLLVGGERHVQAALGTLHPGRGHSTPITAKGR